MASYTEKSLKVLKDKGFRITKPRRLVVELLDKASDALSPYEMKDHLDALGEAVDTVSIYRIINCLEENQLVHRVLATGKVLKCQLEPEEDCRLEQSSHCHHLLICQNCGKIDEIHCLEVSPLIKQLEKETAFKIQAHNLEFLGLCPRCA